MNKIELIHYMNEILKISDFEDDSANGLQVESDKKEIKKIGYAVDATEYLFEKGVKENVDMIMVHHGLFWGKEQTMTGLLYKRIKKLMDNSVALYACHLPLDAHPKLGNNAQLLDLWVKYFKIENYKIEAAVDYHGSPIGFAVVSKNGISIEKVSGFCKKYNMQDLIYNFGEKKEIYSVMFGSGGCGDAVLEAKEKEYDLFLLGELNHRHLINAKENRQSILVGGHYETEVFGVKALAEHVEEKFGIEVVFLDEGPYSI